ncbi:MAG TPA: phospho-sugar mutase [Bacteroidales bacterium]|nr:phospho-sugar mutase [Bacteroidales bacterium]
MSNEDMKEVVKKKAQVWLSELYDAGTRKEVQRLMDTNENELIESFYRDLEFGTGGLRGIMGVGTNRMNIYTVGMATQGLSNYLVKNFKHLPEIKVAIAYDSRNNSRLFAETAAGIFAGNGFQVYLFDSLRPTPELSFAIRHLKCQSGIVLTASHNPKEYNGYKAYWDDGGQVVAPHDTNIIAEVNKITSISDVKFNGPKENIHIIGSEIDEIYTDEIKKLSLSPKVLSRQSQMKIVYTPIHGSGVNLVPKILGKLGFKNIIHVPEQDIPDGNFPTVISPNPEESAALNLALQKARENDADLVMATDPDADRVGIAVKNKSGNHILLNGNQAASILLYYLLTKWKENNKIKGKEYLVKTIVTTELIADMAKTFNVPCYDVLTGFKFIAEVIKEKEGKMNFIGGGEESYGYLAGEFVRDKDAVMSCALIAEAAAWAKDQNLSMYDLLLDIYLKFGFYKESLLSVTKKGKAGAEEIAQMMEAFRKNPPKTLAGSEVIMLKDYQYQKSYNLTDNSSTAIDLPKSNVLQFITKDGSKVSVRPSGTEPKIKFYFGVKEKLNAASEFEVVLQKANNKIDKIIAELNLK